MPKPYSPPPQFPPPPSEPGLLSVTQSFFVHTLELGLLLVIVQQLTLIGALALFRCLPSGNVAAREGRHTSYHSEPGNPLETMRRWVTKATSDVSALASLPWKITVREAEESSSTTERTPYRRLCDSAVGDTVSTIDTLTSEQLVALVKAIIEREEVLTVGEGKDFVLAKAEEYLDRMGIQGSPLSRQAEVEAIVNKALGASADALTNDQLAALVQIIIVRERVVEAGEVNDVVLAMAEDYLERMEIQGSSRRQELEMITNEARGLTDAPVDMGLNQRGSQRIYRTGAAQEASETIKHAESGGRVSGSPLSRVHTPVRDPTLVLHGNAFRLGRNVSSLAAATYSIDFEAVHAATSAAANAATSAAITANAFAASPPRRQATMQMAAQYAAGGNSPSGKPLPAGLPPRKHLG